jgi:hypothetical protein
VGHHAGIVGQHEQEWWVNMDRNLHKQQALIKYPIGHTPYIELPERFNNDLLSFIENH